MLTVHYNTIQCNTIQYTENTVQYSTKQYNTVWSGLEDRLMVVDLINSSFAEGFHTSSRLLDTIEKMSQHEDDLRRIPQDRDVRHQHQCVSGNVLNLSCQDQALEVILEVSSQETDKSWLARY